MIRVQLPKGLKQVVHVYICLCLRHNRCIPSWIDSFCLGRCISHELRYAPSKTLAYNFPPTCNNRIVCRCQSLCASMCNCQQNSWLASSEISHLADALHIECSHISSHPSPLIPSTCYTWLMCFISRARLRRTADFDASAKPDLRPLRFPSS